MTNPNSEERTGDDRLVLLVDDPEEIEWDIAVDVLVIGAGACGLLAALAAAEQGAEVLVVEKEKDAGGNTSLSQAMVPAAGTRMQKDAGIEDSFKLMADDILRKNKSGSDPELTLRVVEESPRLIQWMEENLDIEMELVTDFLYPGHSVCRIHANPSRKGRHLVIQLLDAVSRFGNIDIAYNAPARRLIANRKDATVLGAEIEIEGVGKNRARAKKVVLALNGFGANREMLKEYIPEMSAAYYFGHEGNTGEGIRWGEALGAALECMGAYQSHGSVTHPHGTLLTWAVISLGGYQVNLQGKRFVNEYHGYSEHALDVLGLDGGVAIEIFDDRIFQTVRDYEDFQECVKMGAIKTFDSIEALAEAFNLPVDALKSTHEAFQNAARGDASDPLGRSEFGRPLEPPFHGAKVTGALFHTQGGLKIDEKARVVDSNKQPIKNLYAGGGTAAGFSGKAGPWGYLSANGLLAAMVLGKIAGTEAGQAVRQEA